MNNVKKMLTIMSISMFISMALSGFTLGDSCGPDGCDDNDSFGGNQRPLAFINSIGPNPAHELTDEISFEGYGEDADGVIAGYWWYSSIDGLLSEEDFFTINNLTSGIHLITFYVKDDTGSWSEPVNMTIEIIGNVAPEIPVIEGAMKARIRQQIEFHFVTSDINGDDVFYFVDWDDGTYSEWIGPVGSGEKITLVHSWDSRGSYEIRAKSRDAHGHESEWTTYEVSMVLIYSAPLGFRLLFSNHPFLHMFFSII
jgi:hypothetical protein